MPLSAHAPKVERARFARPGMRVEMTGCIPDGDRIVVRARCLVPQREEPRGLELRVLSREGARIDVPVYETRRVYDASPFPFDVPGWRVDFSLLLPADCRRFSLQAHDASAAFPDASCAMDDERREALEREFCLATLNAGDDGAYDSWFRSHRVTDAQLGRQRATRFPFEPLVSIVVPLFETRPDYFAELYASVLCQSYGKWQLVLVNASPGDLGLEAVLAGIDDERVVTVRLEGNRGIVGNTWAGVDAATGDYIAFLDHDDLLEEDALYEYVRTMNEGGERDAFYCDEDNWTGERYVGALLKPDFNRDLLYMNNYIVHFLMIRADLAREAGPSPDYVEGSQDYDLVLRVLDRGGRFVHIPRVLYHWRSHPGSTSANAASKPYAVEAGRRALDDHFRRRNLDVQVLEGRRPFSYVEEYPSTVSPPVSVIVPVDDDRASHLAACVGSLLEGLTHGNLDVTIVEYGDADVKRSCGDAGWLADPRVRIVRDEGVSGLADAVNAGARQAEGEYLLIFGGDAEVATSDLIERLAGFCSRGEVGVAGAKILAPDGTVEHAGVSLRPRSAPRSFYAGVPDGYPGYANRAVLAQDLLAVTGACQMVKKAVFEEVGGYDGRFEAAYADLDFCLRLHEAGRLVVYDAFSKLHRCRFSSGEAAELFGARGPARARARADLERLRRKWPDYVGGRDPFANPALDRESLYGNTSLFSEPS